jgi:hypothetical protein
MLRCCHNILCIKLDAQTRPHYRLIKHATDACIGLSSAANRSSVTVMAGNYACAVFFGGSNNHYCTRFFSTSPRFKPRFMQITIICMLINRHHFRLLKRAGRLYNWLVTCYIHRGWLVGIVRRKDKTLANADIACALSLAIHMLFFHL